MIERQAHILFKGQHAGILRETAGGGSLFSYLPDWRAPIACCLPVTQREHPWPVGLHPFFQHLGAEGWLRQQQARIGLSRRAFTQAFSEIERGCVKAAGLLVPPRGEPPDGFVHRFADVVRSGTVRIFEP